MKRKLILCLAPILLLSPLGLKAQITLTVTPLPSTLSPGQSFSFNLQLVNGTDPDIIEYDYALKSVASGSEAPVSGIFTLTGLTITSTVLSSANTSSLALPAALSPQIGPANQPIDLGAATPNGSPNAGLGTGTFNLETLTVTVNSNAVPGAYQLELYEPPGTGPVEIFDDSSFDNIGTATGSLFTTTIDVVPEPSSWTLLSLGLPLLAWLALARRQGKMCAR
jgi:hypothetical protein